jgi:hypothetical protein
MPSRQHENSQERAKAIQHIVNCLRKNPPPENPDLVLDKILQIAPSNSIARELLVDGPKRSKLKRIAFPYQGADHIAIDEALMANNSDLNGLDSLAGASSFEFEGRRFHAHAPQLQDGSYQKAKNGTIKILYNTKRLTLDDKNYLRSI